MDAVDPRTVQRIRRRLAALEREKRAQWRDYCAWADGKAYWPREHKFGESELAEIPGLKAALDLLENGRRR